MIRLYNFDELKPEEILNRDIRAEKNVEDVVDAIIADVRARGDDALKDYALKFDGAAIENLQVTQAEIDEAFAGMDPYFLETLRQATENIEQFHRQQVHKNFVMNDRPAEFDWAVQEATAKKKKDFSKVEFFTYDEGLCVQCMHIGPYDTEPETLRQLDAFAAEQGYCPDFSDTRFHHEIYLGDPRRTAPEKLKTVLRHPIRKIE